MAEAQFKIIKTEFTKSRYFETLAQLELRLETYIYWFNSKQIHSTLNYSQVEYR
ncbi:MAG: IS3 family transposase [Breznakia sp.]